MQNENLKRKRKDLINSGIIYFKYLVDEHGEIWDTNLLWLNIH